MKSFLAFCIIGLVAVASPAKADEYHDQCVKNGETSADFAKCGYEWIEREETALGQAWRRTYGSISSEAAKADLLAEQRKWIAYKDSACKFFAEQTEFGSIGWAINQPTCRANVIRDRILQLNQYYRLIN